MFEEHLAPRFKMGRIWIIDTPTPYITQFVDEWVGYDSAPHDDTLDATDAAVTAAEVFGAVLSTGAYAGQGDSIAGANKHPLTRMQESMNGNRL